MSSPLKTAILDLLPQSLRLGLRAGRVVARETRAREAAERRNRRVIGELLASGRPIALEYGAEGRALPGWTSIDLEPGSDLQLDLTLPMPFPDASVERIYASHVFEHFSFPNPMRFVLQEALRILKPGGWIKLAVPNARIVLDAYAKPEGFDAKVWCTYEPALHYHSPVDYVNYMAYMDGNHRHMFDEQNLPLIVAEAGFADVAMRGFDPALDVEERAFESIYCVGYKR